MPVRDAEPADAAEICALIEEHARYEGNETLVLDRVEMTKHLFGPEPKAWVLIAEPPGAAEVAGFAFCSWNFSTWEGRPGIWLDDLYVRPRHRRHGLGRELLGALRARTTGRVEWDMQAGNTRAEAFYRDLGAEPVTGWIRYRWSPEAYPRDVEL
ncbi:GNAT family N-acetyltransferase [Amycolatopsis pigmentata]|uniref:GNAT family N-acetyltransferase n=1 Tax=Amycolatopsis pigmentata TaxID=450801 RepID=A0ABW5FTK9_9PSEU